MATPRALRFCWWNVQDFAHFDPNRPGYEGRWPFSIEQYHEKCRRVDAAFDALFGADMPEVIGLCEITRVAAEELQRRRFPEHELVLGEPSESTAFQVAILIRGGRHLAARQPWFVRDGTRETRPMCVVQYAPRQKDAILFVACHWAAFENDTSDEMRGRCADELRRGVYDFLHPTRPASGPRHVVVFGDFNAEPQDRHFRLKLYASRDRDHALKPVSYHDDPVSRTRLYSLGWRLLGEALPRGVPTSPTRRVGTCYSAKLGEWRTYDHVLVTGGLLTDQAPYLDEAELMIRAEVGNLVEDKPSKFTFDSGVGSGISDHYPLSGRIILG